MRPHTPLFLEGFPQVGLTVGLILLDTLLQGIAVTLLFLWLWRIVLLLS